MEREGIKWVVPWLLLMLCLISMRATAIVELEPEAPAKSIIPSSASPPCDDCDSEAKWYIVYTEELSEDDDFEAHHLRTLTNVLGSEEAAKKNMIYPSSFWFSAKLTRNQVTKMLEQPAVLNVVPRWLHHLDPPPELHPLLI